MTELKTDAHLIQTASIRSAFLTNNSKVKFETWLGNEEVAPYKVIFYNTPIEIQHTYFIKFLNSVGIILEVQYERISKQFFGSVLEISKGLKVDIINNFKSRERVINLGIEEADKILNATLVADA
jgi:hypothetical protein